MASLTQLFRHAVRRLVRAPVFALAATLTLALGVAGPSAVFTVIDGVLLHPMPYDHGEQLVDLSHSLVVSGILKVDQSDATYLLYRRDNRVFADVGVYRSAAVNLGGRSGSQRGDAGSAERVQAALVSAGVFNVLHASTSIGRRFSEADDQPGAPPVIVLGQGLWRRQFASDSSVVGTRLVVDGVEREVVGVMAANFQFPDFDTSLWIPLGLDPAHTASAAFDYRGIARLRDGVSVEAAAADLQRLLPEVPVAFPGRLTVRGIELTHMRAVVRPLRDVVVGDVGPVLWIVFGAAGVLLLIACANVANLFLARAEGRHHELAVRRALGAGRLALAAELLSEAVILIVVAGVLGVIGAGAAVRVLQAMGAGTSVPRLNEIHAGGLSLAVTACAVAVAGLIISVIPIVRSGGISLAATLIGASRSVAGARARHGARRALVVAQVALALILLAGAGLLARSFARLRSVDPGFAAEGGLTLRIALPKVSYPTAQSTAVVILLALEKFSALPGVQAVAATTKLPLDPSSRQDSAVYVEEHLPAPGTVPGIHQIVFVTPDYFRAMGIPVLAGRVFDRPDPGGEASKGTPEVIVSKAFALRYFKSTDVIGKRVRMNPGDPWHTIVGVVGSVHDVGLEQPPTDAVYAPLTTISAAGTPWTPRDVAFVLRTRDNPASLTTSVRGILRDLDPALPSYRVAPLGDLLSRAAARTVFTLLVLGIAAVIAMTIGAVGIYGVISYLVSLRTREIGVRLALGARPVDVHRLVARQALTDAGVGVVAGLAGTAILTRVLTAELFEVSPTDPTTLAGAAGLLLLTAMVASWVPARRAARLDPARALRSE
jgi:putative ABC transport system permease protein